MPPSGTLASYKHTHLSLSSCCIDDWAFSHWEHLHIAIYFLHFILLQYKLKTQKTTACLLLLRVKSANQYLQLLVNPITFFIKKYYTIDLLHSGAITLSLVGHSSLVDYNDVDIPVWFSLDNPHLGLGRDHLLLCDNDILWMLFYTPFYRK
jgi:hypothetical protein